MRRGAVGGAATALAAALALGGCQHGLSPTATPAPAPRVAVDFSDDGANAKLAYGVSLSGAPLFTFECEHGAGVAHITWADAIGSGGLRLYAGGLSTTVAATRRSVEGRRVLTAEAPLAGAALQAFHSTGRVDARSGLAHVQVAVSTPDRPKLDRLFAACAKPG